MSILRALNQSYRDGKLGQIQIIGRRLIGHGPNIFECVNGQFGSRKELDRFRTSNLTPTGRVGYLEQGLVIGL